MLCACLGSSTLGQYFPHLNVFHMAREDDKGGAAMYATRRWRSGADAVRSC